MAFLPCDRRVPGHRLAVTALAFAIVSPASAGASVELTVGTLAGPDGLALEDLAVTVDPQARSGTIAIARASLAGLTVAGATLACDRLDLFTDALACDGELGFSALGDDWRWALSLRHGPAGAFGRGGEPGGDGDLPPAGTGRQPPADAAPSAGPRTELAAALEGAEGSLELAGSLADGVVDATVRWDALPLARLAEFVPAASDGALTLQGGRTRGELRIAGDPAAPELTGELCVEDLALDSADGSIATAGFAACVAIDGRREEGGGLVAQLAIRAPPRGELLLGPVYLDLATVAPTFEASLALAPDELVIDRLRWHDPEVGTAVLRGALPLRAALAGDPVGRAPPGRWRLELAALNLAPATSRYLATALEASGIAGEARGTMTGTLELADGALADASLRFEDVALVDAAGRITISGLAGEVTVGATLPAPSSQVSWVSARVYAVPFGPATARFELAPDAFRLSEPLAVDVFDGRLAIETLAVAREDDEELAIDFEADLAPVSLEPVTVSLGWPVLRGRLSGEIPRVTLRDGVIEMAGALDVDVFDGAVQLRHLRVERLFGVLPTVAADLTFEGLDLQQMTGAFSFGEITGTLEGRVADLRLLAWEPVAFDLSLATPTDDPRRHRISQRAVDDLTSIGGGPSAALSSTFLRFFERFDYAALGLRCRLSNNVCAMGGVGAAPNGGYYIVKGTGLPRIDVVGFAREVDFPQLLRRLAAATESGAPTVN